MRCLAPVLFMAAFAGQAPAALLPYYRMDSLAFLASDVVLCDEVRYEWKKDGYGRDFQEATVTMVRAPKGDCEPKQQLTVNMGGVYTRRLAENAFRGGNAPIPMGRAMFFLKKDKKGAWRPVTGGVKLIVEGEVHCYGQFLSNPGPLYLAGMAPENIDVPADAKYGEEELLKDLAAALDKAKGLTKAERGSALGPSVQRGWR